jgi:bacterial surface protein 26-residue repeat
MKKIKNVLLVMILMISLIGYNVKTFANDIDPSETRYQGEQGGIPWRITNDGTLYISGGNLGPTEGNPARATWYDYRSDINKIVIEDDIIAYGSQRNLFYYLDRVTTIEGLEKLNTSNVTSMFGMFSNMNSMTELDLSTFDTGNVFSMGSMFMAGNSSWSNLKKLNISSFDTSAMDFNVSGSGIYGIFQNLSKLEEITLGANFSFIGNAVLPEVSNEFPYTGKWQNVEDESIVLTSSELMNGTAIAGTYRWQRIPSYTTNVKVFGNGTATASKYNNVAEGESVSLSANPNYGNYFKGWVVVSGGVELSSILSFTPTFENVGEDVELMAVFDTNENNQLVDRYLYTVNDFEIGISEVEGLTDELIIEKANLLVTDVLTNTQIEMEVSSDIIDLVGNYEVFFHNDRILLSVTATVVDDIAPEIIVEHEEVRLEVGNELPETWSGLFGVQATDNVDTTLDITYDIDITTIDMNVVGIYIINATVTDSSENTSTKELTLIVEAKAINEEESETKIEEPVINDNNTNNNNQTTPTTGDVNNLFTMLGLLIISISSIILVVLSKKKVLFNN